jgi:hypothetical protein
MFEKGGTLGTVAAGSTEEEDLGLPIRAVSDIGKVRDGRSVFRRFKSRGRYADTGSA